MKFTPESAHFEFDFEVDTGIDAPSVGFFSETYYYEAGITVKLTTKEGTALVQGDDYT